MQEVNEYITNLFDLKYEFLLRVSDWKTTDAPESDVIAKNNKETRPISMEK